MKIPEGKKIYFSSDNHLGSPSPEASREREKIFLRWLDAVSEDAAGIFLLGDLFDFWFEYEHVVPKGFVRVLGKLAALRDAGIPVYFFVGNHDLWMNDYFEKELQIPTFRQPKSFDFDDKRFFIGHGDGLGPGDKGFKRMKKIFTNPAARWLYKWLHPDLGVPLAQYFSMKNKLISGEEEVGFLGEEREWLVQFCRQKLKYEHFDYFIFGHRHLPLNLELGQESRYVNLGDWITHFTYAVFDGDKLELKKWEE